MNIFWENQPCAQQMEVFLVHLRASPVLAVPSSWSWHSLNSPLCSWQDSRGDFQVAQVHRGPCFCLWWPSMTSTAPFTSLHRSLWDKEASRLGHGQINSNGQIKATTPSHLIIQSSLPLRQFAVQYRNPSSIRFKGLRYSTWVVLKWAGVEKSQFFRPGISWLQLPSLAFSLFQGSGPLSKLTSSKSSSLYLECIYHLP